MEWQHLRKRQLSAGQDLRGLDLAPGVPTLELQVLIDFMAGWMMFQLEHFLQLGTGMPTLL